MKTARCVAWATITAICLLVVAPIQRIARAEEEHPAAGERISPDGIGGAIIVAGGSEVPDAAAKRFVELAGVDSARLCIIVADGEPADSAPERIEALREKWNAFKPASVDVIVIGRGIESGGDATSNAPRSAKTASERVHEASGVWIVGSEAAKVATALKAAGVVDELRALLARRGVVGGNAAGGAALARLFASTPKNDSADVAANGLDLLPGVVVMPGFEADETHSRLLQLVESHPGNFGVGIEDNCALFVRGRRLRVLGEGKVALALAASPTRAARTMEVKSGELADFTALRRMAVGRVQTGFPPQEPGVPEVEGGTLVIVGGGGLPVEAMRRFIELAGGPDALIVVLPTADPSPKSGEAEKRVFGEAGARNAVVLKARTIEEVESPESLDLLRRAGGIWFGGGRQWRFVDTYENTQAHAAMLEMLHRGGVIGGSSAGATIQGDYLCRGNPLGNADIMSEGYERGLGFLPGTAIDQHFAQRNRFAEMTTLMQTYPQYLGIGVDESTALIVQGHVGEVVGRNSVQFYDYRNSADDAKRDYVSVHPGGRYDLKARRVLDPGAKRDETTKRDQEPVSAEKATTR